MIIILIILICMVCWLLVYPMYLDRQGKPWAAIVVAQYTYSVAGILALALVAWLIWS
jgi:hypothetical protein